MFESCWIIRIEHLSFHSDHAKQSQKVSSNTLNSLGFGNTRSLKLYIWDTDIQIDLNLAASFSAGEVFSMDIYASHLSLGYHNPEISLDLHIGQGGYMAFCCLCFEHREIFPYKYCMFLWGQLICSFIYPVLAESMTSA